jgi:hypothetical protein
MSTNQQITNKNHQSMNLPCLSAFAQRLRVAHGSRPSSNPLIPQGSNRESSSVADGLSAGRMAQEKSSSVALKVEDVE